MQEPYGVVVRMAHATGVAKRARGSSAIRELEDHVCKLQKLYVLVSNGNDLDSTLRRWTASASSSDGAVGAAPAASVTTTLPTTAVAAGATTKAQPPAPPVASVPAAAGSTVPDDDDDDQNDPSTLALGSAADAMRREDRADKTFPSHANLRLGDTFKTLGDEYIVVGWKNSRPAYPVIACPLTDLTGGTRDGMRKFRVMLILHLLGRDTQAYRNFTIAKYAERYGVSPRYRDCDLVYNGYSGWRLHYIKPCSSWPIVLHDASAERTVEISHRAFALNVAPVMR